MLTDYQYPSLAATSFLAFHPKDNNFIAVGTEDGTIGIFNCRTKEVLWIYVSTPSCLVC